MEDLQALCWLSIAEHFGTAFQIEIDGELREKRGLFQNASSRIALDAGEYAVSLAPTLTLPIAEGTVIKAGTKVVVHKTNYRVVTVFTDEPKGVIICDLAKAKN
jgi:hypothetical protein